MAITVNFTNGANGSLTVENNVLDTSQISLTLIGKNASNYAQAINENFLHLLENFADSDPPANLPVEGRIWFDTTNEDVPRLRVQRSDGTYPPVAGVWQQGEKPGSVNSDPRFGGPMAGDLWVDTSRGQLYLNTNGGEDWVLIGPQFSSSLRTGSYPDQINDSFGFPHFIIKNYIDDNVVEIIAKESFVPQQKIDGFDEIKPGINLTTNDNAILNGKAYTAQRLAVTLPATEDVLANNFVRRDIDNTINAVLTVEGGIYVGVNSWLKFSTGGTRDADITNTKNEGRIRFVTYNNDLPTTLLNVNGKDNNVGINLAGDPDVGITFQVGGNTKLEGTLRVTATSVTSLINDGGTLLHGPLEVNSSTKFNAIAQFINTMTVGTSTAVVSAIMQPATNDVYDLGSASKKFHYVYASNFLGNVTGTADKADELTNTSSWSISVHVKTASPTSYKGLGGTYTFAVTIDKTAFTEQPSSTLTNSTAWQQFYTSTYNKFLIPAIQVNETAPGSQSTVTNLVKVDKKELLADLYANLIPAGTVVPFAGITAPAGWLLCDGDQVSKGDYPNLWLAIGLTYSRSDIPPASGFFYLPDLRGKVPVGYSNMYNGISFGTPSTTTGFTNLLTPDGTLGSGLNAIGGTTTTNSVSTTTNDVGPTWPTGVGSIYFGMNYIIKV